MGALIFLAAGAFLFAVFGVIGLIAKTASLGEEIRRLSRRIDELEKKLSPFAAEDGFSKPLAETQSLAETQAPPPETAAQAFPEKPEPASASPVDQVSPPPLEVPAARDAVSPAAPEKPPPDFAASLKRFIKGGNAWAAGGVALLAAGFGTLIAWLAGRGFFTLEMGITASALAGLIMLVSGWLFRNKRRVYCLLLQGGGIGILYLSVFAAHKLTPWFSQTAAFILLGFLVLPSAILALFQNSQLMALSGFLGGFAAPFLVSSGGGNHVFLFSYYAILSAAVFGIGLFRFWRFLNLLAFAAVFISAIGWVSAFYKPELFWSAEPFFLGFILLFTALGLRSFGKKNTRGSAFFDGLLLLGTPPFAAVLQWKIFSFYNHGHALVSLAFAVFYLGLGVFIRKRKGREMRLFSESFLGLAVFLANLALPLELSRQVTAAVWAAEGALFYFLGHRLKNGKTAVSAVILHLAAVAAFSAEDRLGSGGAPFLRSAGFSGAMIIALAGMAMLVITRKFQDLKDRDAEGFFSNRGIYHNVFFGCLALWFYSWWFGLWFVELARAFPRDYPGRFFLFASASALAGFALSRLLRCKSLLLGAVPSMAFALGFLLYVIFSRTAGFWNTPALIPSYNFFQGLYRWGWPAFFVSQGLIAAPAKKDVHEALRGTWTFILILTASAVLASSGRALTLRFNLAPSWRSFAGLLPLFAAVGALSALSGKGFSKSLGETTKRLLFFVLPLIFCAVLGLWFVVTLFLSGNPSPLPLYIPLINPLDLLEAFSVLIFLYWQASLGKSGAKEALSRGVLFVIGDIAVFLFVTALLARSMHFYAGIPYGSLFGSDTFQLGLFILWALCGIAHIIAGTRLAFRRIWIAGAALTVVDIAKLLLLDLAAAGAPVRIVSFFAAGLILLFIGWVSPLPPSRKEP